MDSAARQGLVALVEPELLAIEAGREPEAALDALVRKLAEHVGDMCTVSLLEGDSKIRVASMAHTDPAAAELFDKHLSVDLAASAIASRVIKTGRPLLVANTSAKQLRSFMSTGIGPYLDRFGLSSLLVVPMRAEGVVIGCLSLTRVAQSAPYAASDETALQSVGDELALALVSSGLLPGEASSHRAPGTQRKPGFGTNLASFIRGDGPAGV